MCDAFTNHLLKDLEDIQIAQRHLSEHESKPLAVGVLRVVLGVKTKRNALLHAMEEYLHQKVIDAGVYESGFGECIGECYPECLHECSRRHTPSAGRRPH